MIKQVLLDLDGVVVDFVKGICAAHDRPDPYLDPKNAGNFDMDKIWGMDPTEFWKPCGYDFWSGLEFHSEASELIGLLYRLVGLENVCILTSPSNNAGCVDGKRDWVAKNMPEFKERLLIGSAKEFQTNGSRRLLIDDRDENISKFIVAGGAACTFPRPWNAARDIKDWRRRIELCFI